MCLLCRDLGSFLSYEKIVAIAKLYRVLTGRCISPTKEGVLSVISKSTGSLRVILIAPLYGVVSYDLSCPNINFGKYYPIKWLKLLKIKDREMYNYILYQVKTAERVSRRKLQEEGTDGGNP